MYTFKTIYNQLLKYKKQLILANVLAILAVLAHTPIPLIIPMLVDEILLDKPGFIINHTNMFFGEQSAIFYIFFALFVTIVLRVIFFIFEYFQIKIFTIVSKNITFEMRKAILTHLEKVSLSEYEFFGKGRAASLMVTDIETIDEFISKVASSFITSVLHMICVAIILFYISWQMAVLIFIINPFVVFATRYLSKKIAHYKKEQNESYEIFQENLSETLNQYIQVRASNQEKNFTKNLINISDNLRKKSTTFIYKKAGAHGISMALFMTTADFLRVCAILVVAFYNEMSIGQIMAVFSYLWMVVRPMESIVNIQYSYNSAKVALKRINSIFTLQKEPEYTHLNNPYIENKTNSIELKNASFSYNKKDFVLKKINMKIEKGQKVAFVGKSGNGKTTLAQIIVGFYPLSNGELFFDDVNIKDIGLDVVRENVFLVLQNPQLFNATIRYNLTLENEVDEEKIWEALKIAQLHELIYNLPEKLETRVGNHGVKLSGGQRQRLTIARMILKNPNIIILDESTSALDNITEKKLFDDIEEFLKEKTTIIIAHRLSTIKNVDKIFLFNNGNIETINSHEELLSKEFKHE